MFEGALGFFGAIKSTAVGKIWTNLIRKDYWDLEPCVHKGLGFRVLGFRVLGPGALCT